MKVSVCVCVCVCGQQISSVVNRQKASHLEAGSHTHYFLLLLNNVKNNNLLGCIGSCCCSISSVGCRFGKSACAFRSTHLALAGTTLVGEHLLSIASCPPPLVLVELAPAVATEQDGDANETEDRSEDQASDTQPVVVKGERVLLQVLFFGNHQGHECHQHQRTDL